MGAHNTNDKIATTKGSQISKTSYVTDATPTRLTLIPTY